MGLDKHYNFSEPARKRKKYTKQGTNIASEVVISYDKSIVEKYKDEVATRKEEQKRQEEKDTDKRGDQPIGGRLASMGLDASMGKDQRQFQLQALIEKKEVVTLQSAMQAMALAKGTVITYLKEMGFQMYDAETGKFIGAKEGKRVGFDD